MNQLFIVTGGRQSGKTYAAQQIAKDYKRPIVLSGSESKKEIHNILEEKKHDLIIVELIKNMTKTFCFSHTDTLFTMDVKDFAFTEINTSYADRLTLLNLEGHWEFENGKWNHKK